MDDAAAAEAEHGGGLVDDDDDDDDDVDNKGDMGRMANAAEAGDVEADEPTEEDEEVAYGAAAIRRSAADGAPEATTMGCRISFSRPRSWSETRRST